MKNNEVWGSTLKTGKYDVEKCEICGGEGHPYEIEVFHRGCRLSQAFPEAYEAEGGFLLFDPKKMKEQLEKLEKEEEPE